MTRRQTNAAAFLVGLSPLLHVAPGAQVKALGGAGWLGCVIALPVLLALGAGLQKRTSRQPGRLMSFALALWLAVSAAAVLHGCAARYDTAVGVFRSTIPYAILLLLTAVPAALSREKALFRVSEIFLPVVVALLVVGIGSALREIHPSRLIDFSHVTLRAALQASLPVFAVGCAALVLPRIFAGAQPGAGTGVGLCALAAVVCAVTVGMLGAPLTERLELPVFTMLRNTSLLHTVERLDALVAAVWILPDVTALTLLLRACGNCAGCALSIANRTYTTLGAAAAAAGGAAVILANSQTLTPVIGPVLAVGAVAIAIACLICKHAPT